MNRTTQTCIAACIVVVLSSGFATALEALNWAELGPWITSYQGAVAAGAGKVVSTGYQEVFLSNDGVVWRRVDSAAVGGTYRLLWGNNEFLAVGSTLYTSPDGRVWTPRGQEGYMKAGAWNGQRYVVVGDRGHISFSDDGRRWQRPERLNEHHYKDIAWGADRFVACWFAGLDVSEDGENWSAVPGDGCRAIVWTGSNFVAAHDDDTISSSPDGLQWTTLSTHPTCRGSRIVSNGGQLVKLDHCYNWNSGWTESRVSTSETGETWETGLVVTGGLYDVTWTGERWVAVGDAGLVCESTDGKHWNNIGLSTFDTGITDIASNGSQLIAVAGWRYSTSAWFEAFRSDDLLTWDRVWAGYNQYDVGRLTGVLWAGTRWLAFGCGSVHSSIDGEVWANDWSSPEHTSCEWGGGRGAVGDGVVAVALSVWESSNLGAERDGALIVGSENGGWNTVLLNEEGALRDIVWANGRFVAVGKKGLVALSDDGQTWHTSRTPRRYHLNRVAGNGSYLVASGERGRIAISYDRGESWIEDESGFDIDLIALVWAGDRWLAGSGRTLIESEDGITWSEIDGPATPSVLMRDGDRVIGIDGNRIWIARQEFDQAVHQIVLPVATHIDGVGGIPWRTDLWIASTSPSWNRLQIGPLNAPLASLQHTWLPPFGQMAATDIMGWWLDQDGSTSPLMITTDHQVAVASRTYTENRHGRSGQGVSSSPPLTVIDGADPVVLAGLREDSNFRTNVGISNLGDEILDVMVGLTTGGGLHLGEVPVSVPAGGFKQVNGILRGLTDQPVIDAWAVIHANDIRARYLAYASVIDNTSGDGATIVPSVAETGAMVVPAVASKHGENGTYWRSDLLIANPGEDSCQFILEVAASDGDMPPVSSRVFVLPARNSIRIADALASVFGTDGVAALRIVPTTGGVVMSSRTFTASDMGSYGQAIPALSEEDALGPGETAWLAGLRGLSPYHSNLGFVNIGTEDIEVEIHLFSANGEHLSSETATISPKTVRQINRVFGEITGPQPSSGYAIVENTSPSNSLFVWASIVDGSTGDPVFLLPTIPTTRNTKKVPQ